jgi:hypothetical protein
MKKIISTSQFLLLIFHHELSTVLRKVAEQGNFLLNSLLWLTGNITFES